MKKLHNEIIINAPREKVWNTMLEDATYREWTKAFSEGSYYEGSWEKGSTIKFLSPEGGGMLSRIAENKPLEFVSIQHVGMIDANGVEDTESEQVKKWTPAFENYTFAEVPEGTKLSIDMDIPDDQEASFNDMWSKSLLKLKELSEK